MTSKRSFVTSAILTAVAAVTIGGCASGKQVKLEMNREVVLTQPAIQGVSLSPSARVDTGPGPATVTVRMEADDRLKATFEVPGLVASSPMREDAPGVYVGTFDVRQGLSGHVPVLVHLVHEPTGAERKASVTGGLELFVSKPAASGGSAGSASAAAGGCTPEMVRELDAAFASLTVHFEVNHSEMSDGDRAKLSEGAATFLSHPECAIVVHGHADEVGYEGYNLHLSMRRAAEAAAFLESLGVPAARIQRRWHGESMPLVAGGDDTARAKNRRVEFQAGPLL